MEETRELARYVTELRYEDLTPNAIEMAKSVCWISWAAVSAVPGSARHRSCGMCC